MEILNHRGYNVANWNLHERNIIETESGYAIEESGEKLRFFHFSDFRIKALPRIASYNATYTTDNRPDIAPLFTDYAKGLVANGYEDFRTIDYRFGKRRRRIVEAGLHVRRALKSTSSRKKP